MKDRELPTIKQRTRLRAKTSTCTKRSDEGRHYGVQARTRKRGGGIYGNTRDSSDGR
jgi:hypothetical protein